MLRISETKLVHTLDDHADAPPHICRHNLSLLQTHARKVTQFAYSKQERGVLM